MAFVWIRKIYFLFQRCVMAPGLWTRCQSPLVFLADCFCVVNNGKIICCRYGSHPQSRWNKGVHFSGHLRVCELICQDQGGLAFPSARKRNPCFLQVIKSILLLVSVYLFCVFPSVYSLEGHIGERASFIFLPGWKRWGLSVNEGRLFS